MSATYPETKEEKQAVFERYVAAHYDGPSDPKVSKLRKGAKAHAPKAAPPAPRRKKMTPAEYRDKLVEQFKTKHLEPATDLPKYDVTNATRYPAVTMGKATGDQRIDSILMRHQWTMNPQGITAQELKSWRTGYMLMTPKQLGALVRVNERTIRNWENGTSEIPFSMWWMVHSSLQDPEYFLTRPGFHDFYIDYDRERGEPLLCSYTWPDIRYTPSDLYFNRTAINKMVRLEETLRRKEQEVDELTAENTRLRQMLKTGAVTAELNAMHEHLGQLLQQIHTADVITFPEPAGLATVLDFPQSAAA